MGGRRRAGVRHCATAERTEREVVVLRGIRGIKDDWRRAEVPRNAVKADAVSGEGVRMLGQREARRVRGVGAAETLTPKDTRSCRGGVLRQWRKLSEESELSEESSRRADDREG